MPAQPRQSTLRSRGLDPPELARILSKKTRIPERAALATHLAANAGLWTKMREPSAERSKAFQVAARRLNEAVKVLKQSAP
jgi:hypothetical protein